MTLEKEKIEDLFLIMSMKDDDLEQAHKAYSEFHKRYAKYLYAVTKKVCSNFVQKYGDTLTESVFSNTILKVYEKAETFIAIDHLKTEVEKERRLKAWLGKIATNEMKMLLRELKKDDDKITFDSNFINEQEIIAEEDNEKKTRKTFERKLLDSALNSLKEQHRHILLTYYAYEEEGKNMPSNVLDELCAMHDTTKENLRQIKKRSLEKIKKHILEHQKSKSYGQK